MANPPRPQGGRCRNHALALSEAAVGRTLRIGIYSPFFGSTVGGGEKYLGVTAEALRDAFPKASIEIMSPVPADQARYEAMLGLNLQNITFRSTNTRPD